MTKSRFAIIWPKGGVGGRTFRISPGNGVEPSDGGLQPPEPLLFSPPGKEGSLFGASGSGSVTSLNGELVPAEEALPGADDEVPPPGFDGPVAPG
jgi:hypothetical protein